MTTNLDQAWEGERREGAGERVGVGWEVQGGDGRGEVEEVISSDTGEIPTVTIEELAPRACIVPILHADVHAARAARASTVSRTNISTWRGLSLQRCVESSEHNRITHTLTWYCCSTKQSQNQLQALVYIYDIDEGQKARPQNIENLLLLFLKTHH